MSEQRAENDLEHGASIGTSLLHKEADAMRMTRITWQSYLQGQLITRHEYEFIMALDSNTRQSAFEARPYECIDVLMSLVKHICKVAAVQYIMVMIDDLIKEDPLRRVKTFLHYSQVTKNATPVWKQFVHLLLRSDKFIQAQASKILAKLAAFNQEPMHRDPDFHFFLNWLRDRLKDSSNAYIQTTARCLQLLFLRNVHYRHAWMDIDGIAVVLSVIARKVNFQIQYHLLFCIWCLSYTPEIAEKMVRYPIIHILTENLSGNSKEKVIRMTLAIFKNLIEKVEDEDKKKENCISMIRSKLPKLLELLEEKKFDDADILEDFKLLKETLSQCVQSLSSFDEYVSEVKTGLLEWSPVHLSERFWIETAERFNEDNYYLLKVLANILETSKDPVVLSVACYDFGQYVRHYSRGKHVLNALGYKDLIMSLLKHDDSSVRYQALVAVQKIMVQNWEYLGRQVQNSANPHPQANTQLYVK